MALTGSLKRLARKWVVRGLTFAQARPHATATDPGAITDGLTVRTLFSTIRVPSRRTTSSAGS